MKIIFCPKCGSKQEGNAFCSNCGSKLSLKKEAGIIKETIKSAAKKTKDGASDIVEDAMDTFIKVKDSVSELSSKKKINDSLRSFWQGFKHYQETKSFSKGGKYFWFFVGICLIINLITSLFFLGKEVPVPDSIDYITGGITVPIIPVFSSLIMGFYLSLGWSLMFLIFHLVTMIGFNLSFAVFKEGIIPKAVFFSTIILLLYIFSAIAAVISLL